LVDHSNWLTIPVDDMVISLIVQLRINMTATEAPALPAVTMSTMTRRAVWLLATVVSSALTLAGTALLAYIIIFDVRSGLQVNASQYLWATFVFGVPAVALLMLLRRGQQFFHPGTTKPLSETR
jgi:hypothetical protein